MFVHGAPAVEGYLAGGGAGLALPGAVAGALFLLALGLFLRPAGRALAWIQVVVPAAAAAAAAPVLARLPLSEMSFSGALVAFVFGTFAVFSHPGDGDPVRLRRWRLAIVGGGLALAAVLASLALSKVGPLRGLGAALGAAAAVVALVTPFAVRGVPAHVPGPAPAAGRWIAVLPVLAAMAAVAASPRPGAAGDPPEIFGEASAPVEAMRFLDRRFGGSEYLAVAVTGNFDHPGTLRAVADLAAGIRALDGVADVVTPSDVFEMIGGAMIGQQRIPDTIGQVQSLWFFLDGQPALTSLVSGREQGVLQVRLSPGGAKRRDAVLAEVGRLAGRVPARVGIADLRKAPGADPGRLGRAVAAAGRILGRNEPERVRSLLASVDRLALGPAGDPDPALRSAFQARFQQAAVVALSGLLGGPGAPATTAPGEVEEMVRGGLRDADARAAGWLPDDPDSAARLAGTIRDRALAVQDREIAAMLSPDDSALAASPALLAAVRDFTTPWAQVDAARTTEGTEAMTDLRVEVSGFPAMAPAVARENWTDLARWAGLAAVLALVLAAVAGWRGGLAALAALAGAAAWQVGWLRAGSWAIDVSFFAPAAAALAAGLGAWLVTWAGGRPARDLVAAAAIAGAPLLAMAALSSFAPVRSVLGLSGIGIAGAALAAWLCRAGAPSPAGREDR